MFKTGLVQFTDDSAVVVNAVAAFALQQGAVVVVIEGHTDAGGDEVENIRLSQGRADELRRALIHRGLAADHVQAIGRGSALPLVTASHREQYRNRRVEFFVRPRPTTASDVALMSTDSVVEAAPLAPVVVSSVPTLESKQVKINAPQNTRSALAPGVSSVPAPGKTQPRVWDNTRSVLAPRITLLDDDDDEPLLPLLPLLPRVTLLDDVDNDELLLPRFRGPAFLLLDEIGYPDR